MKTHYIPAINESEFNRIAKACDPVLIERRERAQLANIVSKRNVMLRKLHDLRVKPHRNLEEDKRMTELEQESRKIMLEIGRKAR